jgi:hypothetical protein
MTRLTFLFSVLLLCACSKRPKVEKETIVRTLNELIANDSWTFKYISERLDKIDLPNSLADKFFKNNLVFIHEQQNDMTNLKISGAALNAYSRRFKEFRPALIDSNFKGGIYYVFSKPLYSEDGQTVAISITEVCECMLGGWGAKMIYRKDNGIWRRVATWDSWIS